jgi:cytochrome P450
MDSASPQRGLHRVASTFRRIALAPQRFVHFHVSMIVRTIRYWRMPPGEIDPFDYGMNFDQHYMLTKAKQLGPTFKVSINTGHTTCIIGHERARQLLVSHEDALRGCTIDLRPLFPEGHVRGMHGEIHRKYRRLLIQALQATPLDTHEGLIRAWVREQLDALVRLPGRPITREELRSALRGTTAGILSLLLFGVAPTCPRFFELMALYRQLGPEAPAWTIRSSQVTAFAGIRRLLLDEVKAIRSDGAGNRPPSALKFLAVKGELDDTALGNLIYMLEGGHFDLYSLWTWILQKLATHPEVMAAFRAERDERSSRLMAEAIVLETLRLEQSESINRSTVSDVTFEGYLIPKNTVVRTCVWEGHKDPKKFTDPFRFDPRRFIGRNYGIDTFAPFGLDSHHCIAADWVFSLSASFVMTLLRGFDLGLASDGPPRRGKFHWEPGPDFSILLARTSAQKPGSGDVAGAAGDRVPNLETDAS